MGWRDLLRVLCVAAAYAVTARLCLQFATVTPWVPVVWPPAGISLVALWLFGNRVWPGIALGELLTHFPHLAPVPALGLVAADTLEALFAVYLLRRARFGGALDRVRDVLVLLLAGMGAIPVGATIGTAALVRGGELSLADAGHAWIAWWVGDLIGHLVFAPLVLVWVSPRPRREPARLFESAATLSLLLIVGLVAFGVVPLAEDLGFLQPYSVFPFSIWAALRFGLRGVVVVNLVTTVLSTVAITKGLGPFAGRLLFTEVFTSAVVLTSLVLGAALSERDRAVRLRDEFIALASHELRTPLTSLKLGMQHLARLAARARLAQIPPDRLEKIVRMSERQVDRLSALAVELLDAAQGEGGLRLAPERVDLAALVRETLDGLGTALESASCEIVVDAGDPVIGTWDRSRLQQVIASLMANAMKFGHGKPISVKVAGDGATARFMVRDGGPGVAKEHHDRIFHRFERAASPVHFPGMGLGLYNVRRIVAAHGGSVCVESEPERGATFIVSLPREPAPAASHSVS